LAKLIYAAITSLDGLIEDTDGRFDWAMPDAELHAFLNELEAPIRTHLYGRRMYETMAAVWTPRTQLEREFDAEAVRRMKETAAGDISVSGPDLAQHAFRAGMVDEVHLFVFPVIVGGGKSGLPRDVQLDLELLDERRFANGVVHMHHRTR
jgi:dihydrofolate reductase